MLSEIKKRLEKEKLYDFNRLLSYGIYTKSEHIDFVTGIKRALEIIEEVEEETVDNEYRCCHINGKKEEI